MAFLITGPLWWESTDHHGRISLNKINNAELTCFLMRWIRLGTYNLHAGVSTHWGRVTHICVGKLTIIGSDNGLSSQRRQAIIWTNAGIMLIGPLGTNFSEILIEIQTFSGINIFIEENTFENVVCEMLFISSRPQCVKTRWCLCDITPKRIDTGDRLSIHVYLCQCLKHCMWNVHHFVRFGLSIR